MRASVQVRPDSREYTDAAGGAAEVSDMRGMHESLSARVYVAMVSRQACCARDAVTEDQIEKSTAGMNDNASVSVVII